VLTSLLSGEYPANELLSTANSTIAPSLLSLPCRARLKCQTSTEASLSPTNYFTSLHFTSLHFTSLHSTELVEVEVKVTLRLTASQLVSLGVESQLGRMTRYLLLFDSYGLVFVGRPLWREDGSVFCICYWSLPAQSFSGPRASISFLTSSGNFLIHLVCCRRYLATAAVCRVTA
jgi:hypothetical protein